MTYKKTGGRLLKKGKDKINKLLKSPYVMNYHKTILKAKLNQKTISKSDSDILNLLFKTYKNI